MKYTIFLAAILFTYACGGSGLAENFKTALIKKNGQNFTITLKSKRSLHPASPFDIGKTYEDSIIFFIPRDTGIIKGEELPKDSCCYTATGTIIITGDKLKVDLSYYDTDDKILRADSWNGNYMLDKIK